MPDGSLSCCCSVSARIELQGNVHKRYRNLQADIKTIFRKIPRPAIVTTSSNWIPLCFDSAKQWENCRPNQVITVMNSRPTPKLSAESWNFIASKDHKSIDPSSRNKKNSRTMRELFSKVVKGLKLISKECEGRNEDETLKATIFIYSTALLLCRLLLDSPAILSGDIFSLARHRSSHLRISISCSLKCLLIISETLWGNCRTRGLVGIDCVLTKRFIALPCEKKASEFTGKPQWKLAGIATRWAWLNSHAFRLIFSNAQKAP